MAVNALSGSVWKSLVSFSIPFVISYFLQTLYGMADLVIIGQFEGPAAITARCRRQPDHAYGDRCSCGAFHGDDHCHCSGCREGRSREGELHHRADAAHFGILSVVLAGFLINFLPPYCGHHGNAARSRQGDKTLSFLSAF